MKKKKTLLAVLLSLVCLVCAAFGLAACTDNGDTNNDGNTDNTENTGNNGGNDNTDTVVKAGATKIGTVTVDGVTYSVNGEVDIVYKITAKVDDAVCNDILISLNDDTLGTGFATFTYVADSKLTFKAVSEAVDNVTVVLEKYDEGSITPGPIDGHALTVDKPLVLDIEAGEIVIITVATEDGMTYTVTPSSEDVLFIPTNPDATNHPGPDIFDGADYVELNNVAVLRVTAEKDVTGVTITLSVAPTEEDDGGNHTGDFPAITLDTPVTISGASFYKGVTYTLSIMISGDYEFDTEIADVDITISTKLDADIGEATADENKVDGDNGVYTLTSNIYYVTFYNNGAVTVSPYTGDDDGGEGEPIELDQTYTVNYVAGGKPVKFTISLEAGNYKITFGGDGVNYAQVDTGSGFDPYSFYSGNDTNMLPADDYILSCYGMNWEYEYVTANYTITITKIGEGEGGEGGEGGEFDPSTITELNIGENDVDANKIYKLDVTVAGNYTFTGEGVDLLVGGDFYVVDGEPYVNSPYVFANEEGVWVLNADVYYVAIYEGTSLTVTLVTE